MQIRIPEQSIANSKFDVQDYYLPDKVVGEKMYARRGKKVPAQSWPSIAHSPHDALECRCFLVPIHIQPWMVGHFSSAGTFAHIEGEHRLQK
jgi:hypothetical protein